jgi:hypothetical protein
VSTRQLIDNWAKRGGAFFTGEQFSEFERFNSNRRLVFVASLWSGGSQMAFRTLCTILHERNGNELPVLVLDGDSEADLVKLRTPAALGRGNGFLLLQSVGRPDSGVPGDDLNTYRASVQRFLTEVSE